MGSTWAGILIIGGGLLVIVVVVLLLLAAQRRLPAEGGWYAGRATARRPVAEEYYDPAADPDYVGDGLPGASDAVLRGDLAPQPPTAPPPPDVDPG
jgi:hypothetical protein